MQTGTRSFGSRGATHAGALQLTERLWTNCVREELAIAASAGLIAGGAGGDCSALPPLACCFCCCTNMPSSTRERLWEQPARHHIYNIYHHLGEVTFKLQSGVEHGNCDRGWSSCYPASSQVDIAVSCMAFHCQHASRCLRDRCCRHASLETAACQRLSAPVSACQRLSAPVSVSQIGE